MRIRSGARNSSSSLKAPPCIYPNREPATNGPVAQQYGILTILIVPHVSIKYLLVSPGPVRAAGGFLSYHSFEPYFFSSTVCHGELRAVHTVSADTMSLVGPFTRSIRRAQS
jgi:hypothetical protein